MLINSWKGRLEKLLEKREMLVVMALASLPPLSSLSFPLFFIPHPDPPCVFCISFTQCSRLAFFPVFPLPVLTAPLFPYFRV